MAPSARDRRAVALRAIALTLLLLATAALLLRFPPERYSFYPRCPIYTLFHIQCPGCGATRALAAILRGDLNQALRLNALFTLALPIIIVWTALSWRRFLERKPIRWTHPPKLALNSALAITAVFTIFRNL
jgi:hypothetical protein